MVSLLHDLFLENDSNNVQVATLIIREYYPKSIKKMLPTDCAVILNKQIALLES